MFLRQLEIEGLYEITADRHQDDRGFFMRSYDRNAFAEQGLVTDWEEESISFNRHLLTVRGLHYQIPPFAETKIVRVTRGSALDVAVDLRQDSPTYGQHVAIELSADQGNAVYIAAGFAHGFQTLERDTLIEYKINVAYHPELAAGIRWDDPTLNIPWQSGDITVSERDAVLPFLADVDSPF